MLTERRRTRRERERACSFFKHINVGFACMLICTLPHKWTDGYKCRPSWDRGGENIARVWFDCFLRKWELNVIINLPIEKKTHFIFTGFRLPQVVVNCLISRKSQKRSQPCILSETSLVCLRFEDNISFWTSKKVFLGKILRVDCPTWQQSCQYPSFGQREKFATVSISGGTNTRWSYKEDCARSEYSTEIQFARSISCPFFRYETRTDFVQGPAALRKSPK